MDVFEQSKRSSADVDGRSGQFSPDVSGYYELTAVTSTMSAAAAGLEGCRHLVKQVRVQTASRVPRSSSALKRKPLARDGSFQNCRDDSSPSSAP